MARKPIDPTIVTTALEVCALALIIVFFALVYPPANLLVIAGVMLAASWRITRS